MFSVVAGLPQEVASFASEPSSDAALDVEGSFLSLFEPHDAAEVLLGVNYFVVSPVNEQARFLHLGALLAHHVGGLRFVLVGLDLAFVLVGVVVHNLVCLGERVVVRDARTVIAVTAEVRLGSGLLLDLNSYDFDLVVGQTNLHLELVRHHELVSLDRVVVVLLLLLGLCVEVLLWVFVVVVDLLLHLRKFTQVGTYLVLCGFFGRGGGFWDDVCDLGRLGGHHGLLVFHKILNLNETAVQRLVVRRQQGQT